MEYIPKLWNIYTLCFAQLFKIMEFIGGKCDWWWYIKFQNYGMIKTTSAKFVLLNHILKRY